MKIIKQGEAWKKQLTCKRCSCVYEIEESDIKYEVTAADTVNQQYEDDIKGTYYVDCPTCEQRRILTDLPLPMEKRIREKE